MIKTVLFGKESRDKILSGVQKITAAVKCTMGAAGKCVLIGEATYGNDGIIHFPTKVSKDGFTVAKHFSLPDAVEHRGAMLIIEAATKTVEMAGDATTCTAVLAESLITNGMRLIDEGANSQELKKGMDNALEYVVDELNKMSTPVKGNIERIRQIATVSANNDDNYHVFLNSDEEIFIGERTGRESDESVLIPIQDWPEIKKYIDGLYNEWLLETENPFE